ncbi:lipopolysaccharide biosynthesis protein [Pedococcus bigeumensis]|nr:lipopolysaccharide biosynthesis protein [Pedococcus bigeumensis]
MTVADPAEGFGRQIRSGLGWSFASNVLSRMGTLVAGVVLARLLVPTDYGEFTVALVAMVVLANINDLGIEQTIVRWPGSVERIGPTAVTVIFLFSLMLAAAGVAGAGAFAAAMDAPEATRIVQLLALSIAVNGAFAVPSAMLTRSFRQDLRTAADLTGFVVGTTITIVLAIMGYGAWSFAWGRLVGNTVVGILHLVLTPRRFRPGWDTSIVRELLASSLPLGGATVVAVLLLNVDYIVVGRMLGTQDLGYYTLAFNLASWPVTFFAVAVARVSVPAFARLQHDLPRLQRAYDHTSVLLLLVTVPVCLLLGSLADPLVRFVYGDKWAPAATVLQFLAALGLLRVLYQFWADVLVAVGSSRRVLVTQLAWLCALVPGLTFATRDGLPGVGIAHVLVAVLVVGPVYVFALRGIVRPGATAPQGLRLLVGAVVSGVAGWLIAQLPWSSFAVLALGTPVVLGIYAVMAYPLAKGEGYDIRRLTGLARQGAGRLRRHPSPGADDTSGAGRAASGE